MSTTASEAADRAERIERRLSRTITPVEAVLLVASIAATWFAFPRLWVLAYAATGALDGYGWFFAFASLGMAAPGLAIPFVLMAVTPWRYKTVAGVLSTFVLIYYGLRILIGTLHMGFWPVAGECVRFAFLMSGALVALSIWGRLAEKRFAGAAAIPTHAPRRKLETPPRASLAVQLLAFLSVPAIYVGIIAGALISVGIGALLIILLSEAGSAPMILIVAAYLTPIAAIIGAVYSLYRTAVPVTTREVAVRAPRDATPELWDLVSDVCSRVGTREPDYIVLHSAPTFYVMQGRMLTINEDLKGRILAVGAVLARSMSARELQAVLAHEFAHFAGRDTLYSAFTARVFSALGGSLHAIRTGAGIGGRVGLVLYLIQYPAYQYIVAFYRYFMSLNMAISRSRELRADWYAVHLYGPDAFRSGLKKAVGIGAHFPLAIRTLDFEEPAELYSAYARFVAANPDQLTEHLEKALTEEETEFSSHPRLQVRLDQAALVPVASDSVVPAGNGETGEAPDKPAMLHELAPIEADLAERVGGSVLRIQKRYRATDLEMEESEDKEWDGTLDDDE